MTPKHGASPLLSPAQPAADLARKVADPAFTPSVRRIDELIELLEHSDEDIAKHAERAILRVEAQYAARVTKACVARARSSGRPARGRLTRLAGRLAHEGRDPEQTARAWLLEALGDPDPKTRRAAARALGNLERTDTIADALAAAFDRATIDDDRRVLAVALGKIGGEAARARLVRRGKGEGGEHGRASVIAERELARERPDAIEPARAHDDPLRIRFHTRSGLEDVLKEELGTTFGRARFVAPGIIEAELVGPLSKALSIRIATHVSFPLAPIDKSADLARDIVRGIESPPALDVLRAYTSRPEGAPIRFRIALSRGGHRRAVMWRVADQLHASSGELLNDPRASTWELVVDDAGPKVKLELVPRGYQDERFAYRGRLVAASSHPAIAAALARVAPKSAGDVVWDPFVGAGSELVERARLGLAARLIGTDTDPEAVAASRENLARAGLTTATIERADAVAHAPGDVTLILTNPPMGRRVERGTHAELLERFVSHAARVLVPGGALVWLVPEPRRIHARAAAAGLVVERAFTVDMGGSSAELGVYVKRGPTKRGEPPKRRIAQIAKASKEADEHKGRRAKRQRRAD